MGRVVAFYGALMLVLRELEFAMHMFLGVRISSRREERACDTCGFIDARVRDVTQFRTVFKSLGSSG